MWRNWACVLVLGAAAVVGPIACGDTASEPEGEQRYQVLRQTVVQHYAELVHHTYKDALTRAQTMAEAIEAFIAAPSEAGLEAAKQAWLEARVPYGQSEAFRFYAGPIDGEDGPEGRINAWPLDESYIDYVAAAPNSGIINRPEIALTADRLRSLNEGGEENVLGQGGFEADTAVSLGYHAIEFLLWGQDFSTDGPGQRPWQDYLVGPEATAPNGSRRAAYLRLATAQLLADLNILVDAWAPGVEDNYRAFFVSDDVDNSLRKILVGMGVLAKAELGSERIDTALVTQAQEDEHSCFSDNTHRDIQLNAQGVANVYFGTYGDYEGTGLQVLVAAVDPELDEMFTAQLDAALAGVAAMPVPFDQAILDPSAPEWRALSTIVDQLFDVGDGVVELGTALDLGAIATDLPE